MLPVRALRHHNPLSQVFIDAALQAGYPATDDFNGEQLEGVDFYHVTQRDGRRCSTARAFLKPALDRPNLTVVTGALATAIRFDGDRACGVTAQVGGREQTFEGGQVLLSGGAVNSPQLLMLSGIGPGDHLREHGIKVQADLPGVGSNLQDHLNISALAMLTRPLSYDTLNQALAGLRYLFTRSGPGSSNIAEAGAFIHSGLSKDQRPDIQLHFLPALVSEHGKNTLPGSGVTVHACPLRPEARGTLRLASADPAQAPAIRANYMTSEYDLESMKACVRISQDILRQPAFEGLVDSPLLPERWAPDDATLETYVRAKAETVYHPVGTCRMGVDDDAVVDPALAVRGVQGLHVIDASVMPTLVSGNTNAPTIMIAEKAAAGLLAT